VSREETADIPVTETVKRSRYLRHTDDVEPDGQAQRCPSASMR
jgi:hypothetical protein